MIARSKGDVTSPAWDVVRTDALPGSDGPLLVIDREDGMAGRTVCVVPGNLQWRAGEHDMVRLLDEQDIANAWLIAAAPRLHAILRRLVAAAGNMDGTGDTRWTEARAILAAAAPPGPFPGDGQGGSMNKLYTGMADGTVFVHVQEAGTTPTCHRLAPRLDLRSHSPGGFAWGYRGSGPAQLALALACDVLGSDVQALQVYQVFKARFVARLPPGASWGPVSADELQLELAEIKAGMDLQI